MLATMRLCANVPAQHAIQAALGGHQSIDDLVLPGGRLREQRDVAWTLLNAIPGVTLRQARRARSTSSRGSIRSVYPIEDDEQFVLDLLLQEKVLIVQGTGFNWPGPDHFRIVTLPHADDLRGDHRAHRPLPGHLSPVGIRAAVRSKNRLEVRKSRFLKT